MVLTLESGVGHAGRVRLPRDHASLQRVRPKVTIKVLMLRTRVCQVRITASSIAAIGRRTLFSQAKEPRFSRLEAKHFQVGTDDRAEINTQPRSAKLTDLQIASICRRTSRDAETPRTPPAQAPQRTRFQRLFAQNCNSGGLSQASHQCHCRGLALSVVRSELGTGNPST